MRATNITINYGMASFIGSVKRMAEENSKAISFSSFHNEDKGAIGMRFYCKKCNKDTQKAEVIKGYEIAGQTAYFTDEELKAKFGTEQGITIIGTSRQLLNEWQIKNTYTLEPSPDKKTATNNNVMYEVFRQYLIDNNKLGSSLKLVALAKMTSRGIKKGRELALISFSKDINRLVLSTLYYSEELEQNGAFVDKKLDEAMLTKAGGKLFNDITEINIMEMQEEHTEHIMEEISQKLMQPEIQTKAESKPMQKEEELLAKMAV
jgi:non-homologous end joining protein Ku